MKEYELKYGCNPNQKNARIFMQNGSDIPIEILNGRPGYINLLDALNAWQLVKELSAALNVCAAASFKHVSPSGAAIGIKLDEAEKKAYFVPDETNESKIACAYARARGTDRLSSFGDFIALSEECDEITASLIKKEVSDGIIAPSFTPNALNILKTKAQGRYVILKMDPSYAPSESETRQVFGITFQQDANDFKVSEKTFSNIVSASKKLDENAVRDLTIALVTLKYTQSNSVCFAKNGQTIGVGAGQQSRIHCTRLAGSKADNWHLRMSEKTLSLPFRDDLKRPVRDNCIDSYINANEEDVLADGNWQKYFKMRPEPYLKEEQSEFLKKAKGVSVGSDAFFPFSDNIERAIKSGAQFIAEPGGSIRDDDVIECCNKNGIVLCFTGARLFHH